MYMSASALYLSASAYLEASTHPLLPCAEAQTWGAASDACACEHAMWLCVPNLPPASRDAPRSEPSAKLRKRALGHQLASVRELTEQLLPTRALVGSSCSALVTCLRALQPLQLECNLARARQLVHIDGGGGRDSTPPSQPHLRAVRHASSRADEPLDECSCVWPAAAAMRALGPAYSAPDSEAWSAQPPPLKPRPRPARARSCGHGEGPRASIAAAPPPLNGAPR